MNLKLFNSIALFDKSKYLLELSQNQHNLSLEYWFESALEQLINQNSKSSRVIKEHSIVVNLTSYSKRLSTVHYTVLSLLLQNTCYDHLLLWVTKEDEPKARANDKLLKLEEFGLEIKVCEELRSYKKLVPALKAYKNFIHITFDDDVIYPKDQIKRLLTTYQSSRDTIICHRAHKITYGKHGKINPYIKWDKDSCLIQPSLDLLPVGMGGVLYPVNCFDESVVNSKDFLTLAPTADDLWFKVMSMRNGTSIKLVDNPMPYSKYLQIPQAFTEGLWRKNKYKNDSQLKKILAKYPI